MTMKANFKTRDYQKKLGDNLHNRPFLMSKLHTTEVFEQSSHTHNISLATFSGTKYHMSIFLLSLWESPFVGSTQAMYFRDFLTSNYKLSKFLLIATSFFGKRPSWSCWVTL